MKLILAVFLATLVALTWQRGSAAHAAAAVQVNQLCTGTRINVAITWDSRASAVLLQYVDLNRDNNDWQPGNYASHGPLAADVGYLVLQSLPPGTYRVRLNQMLANGSLETSETISFVTMPCGSPPSASVAADSAVPSAPAAPAVPSAPAAPLTPSANADAGVPAAPPSLSDLEQAILHAVSSMYVPGTTRVAGY